jgi:hypothetical protein
MGLEAVKLFLWLAVRRWAKGCNSGDVEVSTKIGSSRNTLWKRANLKRTQMSATTTEY